MGRKRRQLRAAALPAARGVVLPPAPGRVVPRVLAVPAPVLEALAQAGPLEGVPDLRATRLLVGGLIAVFALVALSLGAAVMLEGEGSNIQGNEAVVVLVGLALAAGLGGGLWHLVHQYSRIGGGMFRIDSTGLRWGDPASPRGVAWREVRRTPAGFCDVKTEFASGEAIVKRLVFQQQAAGGAGTTDIKLPLALTVDAGRVLRFRNRAVLLRALLLRLATQPEPRLRFAAEVFIDAGIDPETWEPMLAPRRWMWLSSVGALLPVLPVIFLWPPGAHAGWMVAAMVLAMVAGAGAMGWFMFQRYPGLQGVFEFETAPGPLP